MRISSPCERGVSVNCVDEEEGPGSHCIVMSYFLILLVCNVNVHERCLEHQQMPSLLIRRGP